jgi:uncharacterized protein
MENKVILDCNVWVSYILGKKLGELSKTVFTHNLSIYSSRPLASELEAVLARPKFEKYLQNPVNDYIVFHKELTVFYETTAHYTGISDAKDNYLFDLALQTQATYLVTGDKLLLDLKQVETVEIITWAQFRALYPIND